MRGIELVNADGELDVSAILAGTGSEPVEQSYRAPSSDKAYESFARVRVDYPHPDKDAESAGSVVKVRNLTKYYDRHLVLDDISFDLPKGKIIGLLGPNGCGKTTLIKILAGIIHDYQGSVLIDGKRIGIGTKANTAYLSERTYLGDKWRTVDAIDYFDDFFMDFDRAKALDFADRFGLDRLQKIKTMSKGMQEKVQLLLIMSRKAKFYLLDEPLGGVDPAARSVILDIIMQNYAENSTLMLSTHLVNDLEHSFDHVMVLGHGSVLVNTGIAKIHEMGKTVEDVFKEVIGNAWEVD
ncbi:MAG: ABC transporter ATP-binding protein [Clostridia bacterium]|nr:ABC transporter ATP-binding protein [Clostridia bacterium]